MTETWKPVPDHENLYWVSDLGRVKSTRTQLKPLNMTTGYKFVILYKKTVRTSWPIANLVLTAFVEPRPPGMYCCHNDGDKTNNELCNLRWDTQSNNLLDRRKHGTDNYSNRTSCPRGHDYVKNNIQVKRTGKQCRSCVLAYTKAWYHRKYHNKDLDIDSLSDQYYERILIGEL